LLKYEQEPNVKTFAGRPKISENRVVILFQKPQIPFLKEMAFVNVRLNLTAQYSTYRKN